MKKKSSKSPCPPQSKKASKSIYQSIVVPNHHRFQKI